MQDRNASDLAAVKSRESSLCLACLNDLPPYRCQAALFVQRTPCSLKALVLHHSTESGALALVSEPPEAPGAVAACVLELVRGVDVPLFVEEDHGPTVAIEARGAAAPRGLLERAAAGVWG